MMPCDARVRCRVRDVAVHDVREMQRATRGRCGFVGWDYLFIYVYDYIRLLLGDCYVYVYRGA